MVNYYCSTGCIPGAVKKAGVWLIPINNQKPTEEENKTFFETD